MSVGRKLVKNQLSACHSHKMMTYLREPVYLHEKERHVGPFQALVHHDHLGHPGHLDL
jgi:hypothetical protein